MQLFDTHCHIHDSEFKFDISEVEQQARNAGVTRLLCVGTTVQSSDEAIAYATTRDNCWASVGLHPHDAKFGQDVFEQLAKLATRPKVVAIGECGLDYFYNNSSRADQLEALRVQIELALKHDLPMVFHVREAFDDFWPVFDEYKNLRGVLHSYTDNQANLKKALDRGLYIGLNGIMTFTKNDWQLEVAKAVPSERLLLETDAPFLTPKPFRGTMNVPAHVRLVAEFLADIRGESTEELAAKTTHNALTLFLNKKRAKITK